MKKQALLALRMVKEAASSSVGGKITLMVAPGQASLLMEIGMALADAGFRPTMNPATGTLTAVRVPLDSVMLRRLVEA
jgi:hypothetical protein